MGQEKDHILVNKKALMDFLVNGLKEFRKGAITVKTNNFNVVEIYSGGYGGKEIIGAKKPNDNKIVYSNEATNSTTAVEKAYLKNLAKKHIDKEKIVLVNQAGAYLYSNKISTFEELKEMSLSEMKDKVIEEMSWNFINENIYGMKEEDRR